MSWRYGFRFETWAGRLTGEPRRLLVVIANTTTLRRRHEPARGWEPSTGQGSFHGICNTTPGNIAGSHARPFRHPLQGLRQRLR